MAQPPSAGPPHGPSPGQALAAPSPGRAPVPDEEAPRRRSGHRRRPGPLARLFGRGADDRRAPDDDGTAEEHAPATGAEQPAPSTHDLLPSALASLALRDLTLVESLLRLVEDMEAREEDPELLESLFRIDHLATRMRRNGENLLVLAGQETDSQRQHPAPLLDVVRAGISEISDYYRADVSSLPEVRVAGLAADDVSHLLAELLDNATSKSPQDQRVVVGGRTLDDGTVVLSVEDNGIGIPAERLAELNARLSGPPVLDVSVTRHMGLYVVGRLAHRHGMRVHLDSRPFGGTAAYVLVPPWLVQHSPPEGAGTAGAAGARTGAHAAATAPSAAQGLQGAHTARPAHRQAAQGRPASRHAAQDRPTNGQATAGRPTEGPANGRGANGSTHDGRSPAPGAVGGGLPRRDAPGRGEPGRGEQGQSEAGRGEPGAPGRGQAPSGVNGDADREGPDSLGTTLSGLPRRTPGQAAPPPDGTPLPPESEASAPAGARPAAPPPEGGQPQGPPAGPPSSPTPPPEGVSPPGPSSGPDTSPLDRQSPPPRRTDPLGPDPRAADPLGADPLADPLGTDPLGPGSLGPDPREADPLGPDLRAGGAYGSPSGSTPPPEGDGATSANGGHHRSSAAARLLDDLDGFTAGEDAARHQAQEPQDHDGGGQ